MVPIFFSVDNEEDIIITDDEDDEEEVKSLFFACISIHCQARQVTKMKRCVLINHYILRTDISCNV